MVRDGFKISGEIGSPAIIVLKAKGYREIARRRYGAFSVSFRLPWSAANTRENPPRPAAIASP